MHYFGTCGCTYYVGVLAQVHRNWFVETVERQRVRLVLRWRRIKYSRSAAEEVSPYLAQLADIEAHEEDLLTPAGREVSIVRSLLAIIPGFMSRVAKT